MKTIAFALLLAACGNPGRREVQPLAPQPTPVPGASDKDIMTPQPELKPPQDAPLAASAGGSIKISVPADAGTAIDGAALPTLPDALVPDAGQPMRE
jgi:hypothetical protein